MPSSTIVLVLLFTALVFAYKRNTVKRPSYPPGPPPRLLFGNFFDFPQTEAYKVYKDWGKIYGDIIHIEAFGQHVIILNSQETSLDLLERRSGIYSDRAVSPLMNASSWSSWNFAFMPYGKAWRIKRKMTQQYMKLDRIQHYESIQVKRALELVENLSDTPDDFLHHVRTASTGIIMSILYDHEVAPRGDPYVDLADGAVRDLSQATVYPGSDVINSIPILPYLPSWLPFQKRLAKTRETAYTLRAAPFEKAREALVGGATNSSMVNEMLSRTEGDDKQADVIRDVAGSLYGGGADTTPSSMGTFFLAMASDPRVQRAGQAEIDKVTGGYRFPEFSDRPNMPYVDAIVREVFRCGIVLPLSVPHVSTVDDIYNGYFIPKGSIIISNIWAINNDERTYLDPSEFRPERHLTEDGKSLVKGPGSGDSPIFGHGRRRCPGRYLADTNVWIAIAYILSAFDINSLKDVHRMEINDQQYVEGLVYQPKPFRCTIQKRSKNDSGSQSL